jgi:hypothetical protein
MNKADSLTAICEPQSPIILQASVACYRDSYFFFTMKVDVASSSEILVTTYQNTRCHNS